MTEAHQVKVYGKAPVGAHPMSMPHLNLLKLLIGDLTKGHRQRIEALREFFPAAQPQHWQLITAGQRAQIVKADPRRGGRLTFGTELISSPAGTITGVLGASPGASTAVPLALAALERLLPQTASSPRLRDYLPARELDLTRDEAATVWARQEVNTLLEV